MQRYEHVVLDQIATTDEMAMTNVTAAPMPTEVLTLLDTPKNGQMPKTATGRRY